MDIFSGDRIIQNDAVSHTDTYLTPFHEPLFPIFSDPMADIRPPHPQKLRPIRRNGDDYANPELGFLTRLSTHEPAYPCTDVSEKAVEEMKSKMSSSSVDYSRSSEEIKEPTNRNRKRKKRKMLAFFIENIVSKVLYNQEQMHKQLLEILERNEKMRLIREEAWKKQESERAKRDEKLRIEEASRSQVHISYIRDLLGLEIQIPKFSCEEVSCPERNEEITNHGIYDTDPSNAIWSRSEVHSLITVRVALDHKFPNHHESSPWELVAARLFRMGYDRPAEKCKAKWEYINKCYRKTLKSGNKHPPCSKSYPYFQELDMIYKNRLITHVKCNQQHLE